MKASPPRKKANLSDSVHQQLSMYALAAGAAGVSALALAQPSEARIIYTPAHHRIGPNQTYEIDLNHDGKPDFRFSDRSVTNNISAGEFFQVVPTNRQNGVVGHSLWAFALRAGEPVGPKRHFSYASTHGSNGPVMTSFVFAYKSHQCKGHWDNVTGYLGLKFIVQGKLHFGWARLKVSCSSQIGGVTGLLTGYAYETIANKPIVTGAPKEADDENQPAGASFKTNAPEPATLGMLALGAPGLSIWRRENGVAAPESI